MSNRSVADVLFSKRQQKVLRSLIFADAPQSLSDLIREAGPGHGATQRVTQALLQSGVVIRQERGNQRLFQMNTRHPVYPELLSICIKTFGLADLIRNELLPLSHLIQHAFVFGAYATSEAKLASEVDLLVIADIDHFALGDVLERLEKSVGRKIDLNLYSSAEWVSLQEDRVIRHIVAGPKIIVAGGDRSFV